MTDLAKAFRFSRFYFPGNGNRRPAPLPAREAIGQARRLVAALPDLERQETAARLALAAQRAIDSRRYAPGMEEARAAYDKASRAASKGRAFKYAGGIWGKGYCGTWQAAPGLFFVEKAESLFRNVIPAADLLTGRDVATGFYADPYQENICAGYVVQLPSREGRARYAPAYGFSEYDSGGLTVDLSAIEESDFEAERDSARRQIGGSHWQPRMDRPGYWAESAHESARKEAARAAQGLAESAAEKEREYQTAWQAGNQWAYKLEEEKAARREALAMLKERKAAAALSPEGFPALCGALRQSIGAAWQRIQESREERAALAEGDSADLYFYPDKSTKAAFCDGAGIQAFPS